MGGKVSRDHIDNISMVALQRIDILLPKLVNQRGQSIKGRNITFIVLKSGSDEGQPDDFDALAP